MIRRTAGTVRRTAGIGALGLVAIAAVGLSQGGRSEGETPPGEHATAWSPPPPSEVPLTCTKGMTFAPAPNANAHAVVPAPGTAAGSAEAPVVPAAPAVTLAFASPGALARGMTDEAHTGFPGLLAGLVQYGVGEQLEAEATIIGTVAGRAVVLAPAVRRDDGTWMWRDARPVLNPNGVWIAQGSMIACNEVFERV